MTKINRKKLPVGSQTRVYGFDPNLGEGEILASDLGGGSPSGGGSLLESDIEFWIEVVDDQIVVGGPVISQLIVTKNVSGVGSVQPIFDGTTIEVSGYPDNRLVTFEGTNPKYENDFFHSWTTQSIANSTDPLRITAVDIGGGTGMPGFGWYYFKIYVKA